MDTDFVPFDDNKKDSIGTGRSTKSKLALLTDVSAPWMQFDVAIDDRIPPMVRFHNEILSFCAYISLTKEELLTRKGIFDEIKSIALELWPDCSVHIFGSQLTNVLTPTSDLDICILDVPCPGSVIGALSQLEAKIRARNIVSYLEVLSNAKVPILKLDHLKTGISVDVCINNSSGLVTGMLMRRYLREYPPLKPLVVVMKVFLSQRQLHETYTGGIGSFVLCNLVLSFLQNRQRLEAFRGVMYSWNLGALLLDFLEFYGSTFNYVHVGVSVLDGGRYYAKRDREPGWCGKQLSLSVENPDFTLEKPVDIGKNSFMMGKIKRAFEHGWQLLTSSLSQKKGTSYLNFIIRPDEK